MKTEGASTVQIDSHIGQEAEEDDLARESDDENSSDAMPGVSEVREMCFRYAML